MNKKRKIRKKQWLKLHNLKNLSRRTKRKNIAHKKRLKSKGIITSSNIYYDRQKQEYSFVAPKNLSIINNPNETITYFNEVLRKINEKVHYKLTINFLFNEVEDLSIDSIMYMLAITKNTKKHHSSKGSYPIHEEAKAIFMNSGFLKFVRSNQNVINPNPNEDIRIRIKDNSYENAKICKEINTILMEKYSVKRKDLRFLYDMLNEMMINTNEHAYNKKNGLLNNWYVYIATEKEKIKISFLDTGLGIPNTVSKNFFEKINLLGLKSNTDFILSALNGEFMSSTKQAHRGKGLPKFTKYNKAKKIHNFKIISGKGMVWYNENNNGYCAQNLDKELVGTVYYFEINVANLKEERKNVNN